MIGDTSKHSYTILTPTAQSAYATDGGRQGGSPSSLSAYRPERHRKEWTLVAQTDHLSRKLVG